MPLHNAIAMFAFGLILAVSVSSKAYEQGPRAFTILTIAALSLGLSAMSAFFASTRRSGTGFMTEHGWPKPFLFRFLTEDGIRSSDLNALYFVGNSIFFAGLMLTLWAIWTISRRLFQQR